jgi:glyoxylase I family protein
VTKAFRLAGILCLAVVGPLAAQTAGGGGADSLLGHLVGRWRMTGTVRGRPATYTLDATRVLQGRYVELHMTDAHEPPTYEARVSIGVDTTPGRVIAHWLDNFGAAYSVPAATGEAHGDTLVLSFAYRTGPFHDTFVYDRGADRWHFRLESADSAGGGASRLFAEYDVIHVGQGATPREEDRGMEKVTGIGGLFFRSRDPAALARWYEQHLGVSPIPSSYGAQPWRQEAGPTAFAPFPHDTKYFGQERQAWMVNFRVRNLDAMVAQLRAAGIEVTVDPERYPNGRFARAYDPEGNPVELWEPHGE